MAEAAIHEPGDDVLRRAHQLAEERGVQLAELVDGVSTRLADEAAQLVRQLPEEKLHLDPASIAE